MSSTPTQPTPAKPSRRNLLVFPGLVFAFIGLQACWMSAAVYFALSDRSFAVEPDYYAKAVQYEDQQAQALANKRMGWTASMTASTAAGDQGIRAVSVDLRDALGQPVTEAAIQVEYFHRARGNDRLTATIPPTADGAAYSALLPMPRAGAYEFRLVATENGATYTQTLVVEAP